VVEHGGRVVQETRLFDSAQGRTLSMRSKEEAHDYRYFPEPDLPPLIVDTPWRDRIAATLPELPEARQARFVREYALPAYDATLLTQTRGLADYFERVARASGNAKAASNWIMGEVLRAMKERDITIDQVPLAPDALAELIQLVDRGTISSTVAKGVFARMYDSGRAATEIVAAEGLAQNSDVEALSAIVRGAVAASPDAVAQIRNGRNNAFGFLVGSVMKQTSGKANPKLVTELLKKELGL
jgi:aspartyl-tRNA(Asn)/glutamyl-tRNA(Gln) amidotransferase subunit B